jgi:hypothetical protein
MRLRSRVGWGSRGGWSRSCGPAGNGVAERWETDGAHRREADGGGGVGLLLRSVHRGVRSVLLLLVLLVLLLRDHRSGGTVGGGVSIAFSAGTEVVHAFATLAVGRGSGVGGGTVLGV